jgi:hemerythrin superfamily protein
MDKTTAKIKGAVSKIGAVFRGEVGILGTLEGEHTEVRSLMDDVVNSKSLEKQRELYTLIRQELLLHANGEEQGIYVQARTHATTRTMADKAIQDHTEVRQLLAALDELEFGSAQWLQKFGMLRASVEAHVEYEERSLFPAMNDILGADTLRELDDRYKEYRKRIEERGERLDIATKGTSPMI